MRNRWILVLAAACALSLQPRVASAAGSPYSQVSRGHWSYQVVRRLEDLGYFSGSPAGTFSGTKPLTRYAFASAIDRMYPALEPRVLAASSSGSLREEVTALRRLLSEFSAELQALGADPDEMRKQLDALEQRVEKIAQPRDRNADTASGLPLPGNLGARREYGVRAALAQTFEQAEPVRQTRQGLAPAPLSIQPGLAASMGPFRVAFGVQRADALTSMDLPFETQLGGASYLGELSYLLAGYAFRAYYGSQGDLWDRYGFMSPYFNLGAHSGVGGEVSGSLTNRLAFELGAASLRPEVADELRKLTYLRGALQYSLGRGFSLDLGVEFARLGLSDAVMGYNVYSMGVGRRIGNAQLSFLYRYYTPGAGANVHSTDSSASGAVTQISVRF